MTLLQFNNVEIDHAITLSFKISAGEARVLTMPNRDAKFAVLDLALGELIPEKGEILLQGQAINACKPGSIGWIPSEGGLISNLKTWENITLPLWYLNGRDKKATEKRAAQLLAKLGLAEQEWEKFMASPVADLALWEKKLACLMRGLLQAPHVLMIGAGLFEKVDESMSQCWIAALEDFVKSADRRAVLVVASRPVSLPWETI